MFLCGITDVGEQKGIVGTGFQREVTVDVGRCSGRSSLHCHSGTDKGFTLRVDYLAGDGFEGTLRSLGVPCCGSAFFTHDLDEVSRNLVGVAGSLENLAQRG